MKVVPLRSILLLATLLSVADATPMSTQPHIIFIVADDLGWNDVGFHNPTMITPNIDKLAKNGVIFNQSYVQPVCSPSRAAFLTGMYPFKTGLQHNTIGTSQAVCVPFNYTFLPQELKKLGYATHAVGKWHLGFCKWECTPTYRGFDTFFGYYNGREDYYSHSVRDYLDYRNNSLPANNYSGVYSAYTFAKRAEDIIRTHNKSQPLFMYLPFQNVHEPTEVPKKYEDMYPHVVNDGRRIFCGMVYALDEAIGNITQALEEYGLYDNALILFTTDNGGPLLYYANNYPLRGGKFTIWEGGTRGTSFMYGVGLNEKGITYDGVGEYKLFLGYPGEFDGWYKPFNDTHDTHINRTKYYPGDLPVRLYNLQDDPTERKDLSQKLPKVVDQLRARIKEYRKQMVPANYPKPEKKKSDPKNFGNVWSPGWC